MGLPPAKSLNSLRIPWETRLYNGVPSSHTKISHRTLSLCKRYIYGGINRSILIQKGVFQNIYLVVTVGYLIDFRFVVLFIFQAFFSTEERTEHKKPTLITTLIQILNQQWHDEGQNLIGNNPNNKNIAQPIFRASRSFRALDSFHGSSY